MADYGYGGVDDLLNGEDLVSHTPGPNEANGFFYKFTAEQYAMAYVFAAIGLLWVFGYSFRGR